MNDDFTMAVLEQLQRLYPAEFQHCAQLVRANALEQRVRELEAAVRTGTAETVGNDFPAAPEEGEDG